MPNAPKPPWNTRIAPYGIEDAETMREILLAAGMPARIMVKREGDVRETKAFVVTDPETPHGAMPDWYTSIGFGEDLGDYLRGFVPRYAGRAR